MDDSVIAIIITLISCVLFVLEIYPLAVTAMGSALAMAISGVITFKEAFSGFSSDTLMLVIGVSIVSGALFETGVTKEIGALLSKRIAKNEKRFLIVLMSISGVLSAFLSNTAVTALNIPIVNSVVLNSKGRIRRKNILLGVVFATTAGGLCTLIAAPTQLVAQAILIEGGHEPLKFFSLAWIGVPLLLAIIIFYATVGYKLQKKLIKDIGEEIVDISLESQEITEVPKYKKYISIASFGVCIIGFTLQIWTVGTVAMFAAILCMVTGCISEKCAYTKVDWSTVFVLGGSLGYATGIEKSGAALVIANNFLNLLGEKPSAFLAFLLIFSFAVVVTNLISNVALVVMLLPIGIAMASSLNMNINVMVIGVIVGASLDFATPIGTPHNTLAAGAANYSFRDFLKMGSIVTLIAYIITIVIIPNIFK